MAFVNLTTVFLALSALTASAADFPPGLIVPQDLPARAARQARAAAPVVRALRASQVGRPIGPTPSLKSWDWSAKYEVPVISQGSCGSCWACATACSLSFQFVVQTGTEAAVSAQDVLNCSGEGSCGGGWVAYAAAQSKGYADAEDVPYAGRKTTCRRGVDRPYKILTWEYLAANGGTPSDEDLKRAICETGAVWVGIRADNALSRYTAGSVWSSPRGSVNHAVTAIGWDDMKRAWLIRNSWGEQFGDRGNFWCAYGSNVGTGAAVAWVVPNWIDPDTARTLEVLAGCGCPPEKPDLSDPSDGVTIDGPTSADCGTLVRLVAPELPGARYSWSHVPDPAIDASTYLDTGRRTFVLATPCTPGQYSIVCTIAQPDQDPLLIVHGLAVGTPPTPPVPPVPPVPPPGPPPPAELDDFGRQVKAWALEIPEDPRKAAGEQIAAGFASVVPAIQSGKITTLGEAQAAVRGKYSAALRPVLQDWVPFFDRLTAAYLERKEDLQDSDLMVHAAEQLAAGIRAALQPATSDRSDGSDRSDLSDQSDRSGPTCPGSVCPQNRPAGAPARRFLHLR